MSLFGDDHYQWRETFFILFHLDDRPQASEVENAFAGDRRIAVSNIVADENGRFESLTLRSPEDCSAMDISFVSGDEVREQVAELLQEFAHGALTEEERAQLDQLADCDARLDVFHFEEMQPGGEEDRLDPGGLLVVLEQLTGICRGIGIDPQSGSFML